MLLIWLSLLSTQLWTIYCLLSYSRNAWFILLSYLYVINHIAINRVFLSLYSRDIQSISWCSERAWETPLGLIEMVYRPWACPVIWPTAPLWGFSGVRYCWCYCFSPVGPKHASYGHCSPRYKPDQSCLSWLVSTPGETQRVDRHTRVVSEHCVRGS